MPYIFGDYKECKICGQYGYFGGNYDVHECQQTWNVWNDEDAEDDNTERQCIVYAGDAEAAAERYAQERSYDGDGPFEGTVCVREWNGSEEEQGPVQKFSLEPVPVLTFNVTAK